MLTKICKSIEFCNFLSVQELPEGAPDIVQPSLRSIDVEGMRKDILKFYKFMPPSAVDQWKERLLHLDSWLLCVPERPYRPLEDLLRATRPSLPESEEEAVASLQLLRDKELAPIKEVILKKIDIFEIKIFFGRLQHIF